MAYFYFMGSEKMANKNKGSTNSASFSGKSTSYKNYMNLGSAFMPIPNKANPYTYIDTLKEAHPSIWDGAVALVNSLEGTFTMTAEERRDTAINFLRTTAAQWQSNELAFVENELKKLQESYKQIPSPDIENNIKTISNLLESLYSGHFDYRIFSSAISIAIKGIENYQGRLSNIQANLAKPHTERFLLQNIDNEYKNILDLLNGEANWLDQEKKGYERQVATFIYNYVDETKDKLQSAMLSDSEFAAWLLSLAVNFNVFLENRHAQERESIKKDYYNNRSSLEKNFNDYIDRYNESLTAFTNEDKKILRQIASSIEMREIDSSSKRTYIKLPSLNNNRKKPQVVFTSNLKPSALDERMGLLVRNKIKEAFLQMGGTGMGDDSLLSTLQIGYTEADYNLELEAVNNTLKKMENSMADFTKLRGNREKMVEAYQSMNEKIENTLKNLDSTLQLIDPNSQAFIIHESDKYYQQLEQGFEKNWNGNKGFHGRTMAILNYIDIMSTLSQNFGIGDPQLMKFVAYNLESNSPGHDKIDILEEIFTYAAGMIMFDDIAIAVKESIGTLEFGNITNLHLYKLQELYYPGSYLLFETANYLAGCPYDESNAAVAQIEVGTNTLYPKYVQAFTGDPNSATAKLIKTFQNQKTAEEQWDLVRNNMIANTKVSIHFFLNFAQFVSGMH